MVKRRLLLKGDSTTHLNDLLRRAFKHAAERVGLRGVRPYDLRHSYGTALYRVVGDTRLVKDMLGHSDTRMTERYTLGQVPAAMRAAITQFEAHLAEADEAEDEGATTEKHADT